MTETYADRVVRIARNHNISTVSAGHIARAEIRIEERVAQKKQEDEEE